MTDINALRAEHEATLLAIAGVIGISTGGDSASPVLVIYTDQPPESVAARLPERLKELPLRFVFAGEVGAQEL